MRSPIPLLLLLVGGASLPAFTLAETCLEKGFGEGLVCSSCKKFEEIVKDEELAKECMDCCTDDKAVVSINRFPEVRGFIQDKGPSHKNLKVDYVRGANPVLVMEGPNMDTETVSIANWKIHDIEEYLNKHLLA
eukprot:jgi/Bigna1/85973/estExt_fgenesh1_pg.C_70151